MNIYKKLINNSIIFAIGNLGSKLIVILLVPLYTYYLTTSEFGLVDLVTITASLLIPIFSMCIFDATLRFVMDKKYDEHIVLINSLVVIFIGFILLCAIYPALIIFLPFDDYILYFYLLVLFQAIYTTLTQYIRAKGMIRLFAISGIINSFILLVCNLLFLALFQAGIVGYLISFIISYIVSSLLIIIRGKIQLGFNVRKINIKLLKEMLIYSIPLIPNALMWWIMSFSDRYLITLFLGLSANGLYAVANKIPSILTIINSVFFQAWQMSAIEEAESKNKNQFFSNVFNVFSIVMLISTSLIIVHLKFMMELFVADTYSEAWKYVPFLLLGVVFSSFSSFLGTNYIAARKTSGVFKTSVIGAVINIVVTIALIPILGINGAAIGTMICFAVIWILRILDTRQFVNIKFNLRNLILTFMIIFIQIIVLYLNFQNEYLIQISLLIIIILINFREIGTLSMKLKGLVKRKLNHKLF